MKNYIQCCDGVVGMLNMDVRSVHLVVVSPPWGKIFSYGGHKWNFKHMVQMFWRVLVDGGIVCWNIRDQIVNGNITLNSHRQAIYFQEMGFNCQDIIVIEKSNPKQIVGHYGIGVEMVYVFSKGKTRVFNPIWDRPNSLENVGKQFRDNYRASDGTMIKRKGGIVKEIGKRRNIWRVSSYIPNQSNYARDHPARMQPSLAHDLIISYSDVGDTVLDPMMGTATTCEQALWRHRNYIGFEINPRYFRHCERRMKEAWEKLRSGRSDP